MHSGEKDGTEPEIVIFDWIQRVYWVRKYILSEYVSHLISEENITHRFTQNLK